VDDQQDAVRAARRNPAETHSAEQQTSCRDIVVIGGSAGALEAMLMAVSAFGADFAGSVFVVSHIGANRSHLPELLSRAGTLPAKHPENAEEVRPGIVYVAPPDRHMMIEAGRLRLSRGPRQHFTRPAIDPLFRSAAREFGPRVIGVVLSGAGSDGAVGLDAIKQAGGVAVIQEPESTLYPEMPRAAAAAVSLDHVVKREELPKLLQRLSSERVTERAPTREPSTKMDERERPIALTCPDCGGALREDTGNGVKDYRCHIGHRFSPEEVLTGQLEAVDHAVGVALRVLNERIELCRHMADNARAGGRMMGIDHWKRLEKEAENELTVLQRFLNRQSIISAAQTDADTEPVSG
jgi:two-component system chemotaxis response regulator CheB